MKGLNKVIYIDELPSGNYKTKAGATLTPDQFEKLQRLDEHSMWIIFVDSDLQRKRTDATISLDFKKRVFY